MLLMAYPRQISLGRPPLGEPVGRAWVTTEGQADTEVSSTHLSFVRHGHGVAVMDERSRNGTFVDGRRVLPGEVAAMSDGAVLRLGNTLLVYRQTPARTEPASPIDRLVGPWGLTVLRKQLAQLNALQAEGVRNVLVQGETGTGKELVAEAVAQAFRRRKKYAVVNMAAISPGVFEAHLFGWKRGAYSGSAEGGPGVFTAHDGGAVFLDEIGELPLELQPKLLRLLDNQEIQMVGAPTPTRLDVRIIAATNRDLSELVAAGKFRADLLARFDRTIRLPALRERPEDVYAILSALAVREKMPIDAAKVEVEAVERLLLHDWSTNIRELRAVLFALDLPGHLTLQSVARGLEGANGRAAAPGMPTPCLTAKRQRLTSDLIEKVIAECGNNTSEAARRLGISRGALIRGRQKRDSG